MRNPVKFALGRVLFWCHIAALALAAALVPIGVRGASGVLKLPPRGASAWAMRCAGDKRVSCEFAMLDSDLFGKVGV